MAGDNLTTTDGKIATDELNFVNGDAQADPKPHAQRNKLGHGADGQYFDVDAENPLPVEVIGELVDQLSAVRFALLALNHSIGLSMPDVSGRLRVAIDAITGSLTLATITTVGTVTTVASMTNQVNIGGNPANVQIPALMGIAADSLRSRITV